MAAKSKKGAIPLSEAELIDEVVSRLESAKVELSKAQVKTVVKALKEEVADCLQNGYKVNLSGLVIFTPKVRAGKKKGTVVRNPQTGETSTIKKDMPDEFKVGARVSKGVVDGFPSLKSNAGQELHKRLYKKPAKKKGK